MCLLTVFSPEAELNEQRMTEAAWNNPDGFGFALLVGDHIARFRSMSFSAAFDYFGQLRSEFPDAWGLFHHRFSTGGGETVDNCHPFTWAHDERLAIAHNGVLPIKPGRRKSDTRIWAEHNLDGVSPSQLDDNGWFAKTETWLGSSKAVVLSSHPDTEYGLYILNEHLGHWEDGVWWSNRSYQSFRSTSWDSKYRSLGLPATTSGTSNSIYNRVSCGLCHHTWNMSDDCTETECDACGTCWLCEEPAEDCLCWQPRTATVDSHDTFTADELRLLRDAFDDDIITERDNLRAIAEMSLNQERFDF